MNHTFASHLALSASPHPLAGIEGHVPCEYPVETKPLAVDLTTERLLPDQDGQIQVPEGPGLGLAPNLEVIRRYLVDTEIVVGGKVVYRTPEV